ncbi:MAG TPA: phospholipase, partial [Myxococcaceae bacterium]|nr:phospholipase [Myxococcaceae bacterium]
MGTEGSIPESIVTILGELRCVVVSHPRSRLPHLAVVLCHGYGAPGRDLVPLANEILIAEPNLAEHVRFVFPEAPVSLASLGYPEGRAWWPLDIERLARLDRSDLARLQDEAPEGLPRARRLLIGLLQQVSLQMGLPLNKVVVGGFSQGAMLATDAALHLEERPAGLVVLSGALLCRKEWAVRARTRAGLAVLQTHGRQDPLLPFAGAEALRDLLVEAGLSVEFLPFEGGHTIPRQALKRL